MESPRPAKKLWFLTSDQIPDGELVVPVETQYGTALAMRPKEVTPELIRALNESVAHLVSIGLLQVGDDGFEPPRKE